MSETIKKLYEVRPVKPILSKEGRSIRRPFSAPLTIEEVKGYMVSCTVYRCFPDVAPVRVTGENLEELHSKDRFNIPVIKTVDTEDEEENPVVVEGNEEVVEDEVPEEQEKNTEEAVEESTEIVEDEVPGKQEENSEEAVEESTEIVESKLENVETEVVEENIHEINEKVEESNEDIGEEVVVENDAKEMVEKVETQNYQKNVQFNTNKQHHNHNHKNNKK